MEIVLVEFYILCELHPARQWTFPLIKISTYLLFLFIKGWKEMAYIGNLEKVKK